MPAEGLSSLGSPSGGVCGATASLALALLAAARGAARQRLGVSAGDARLGVAVGAWPGEEGIDVQGANALPLLSASAAAEGAVALAAAALAAVAASLAAVAATCKACTSTRRIRCRARQRLVVSAEFSARAGLLATACALSAAKRLRGVVLHLALVDGHPLRHAGRVRRARGCARKVRVPIWLVPMQCWTPTHVIMRGKQKSARG